MSCFFARLRDDDGVDCFIGLSDFVAVVFFLDAVVEDDDDDDDVEIFATAEEAAVEALVVVRELRRNVCFVLSSSILTVSISNVTFLVAFADFFVVLTLSTKFVEVEAISSELLAIVDSICFRLPRVRLILDLSTCDSI